MIFCAQNTPARAGRPESDERRVAQVSIVDNNHRRSSASSRMRSALLGLVVVATLVGAVPPAAADNELELSTTRAVSDDVEEVKKDGGFDVVGTSNSLLADDGDVAAAAATAAASSSAHDEMFADFDVGADVHYDGDPPTYDDAGPPANNETSSPSSSSSSSAIREHDVPQTSADIHEEEPVVVVGQPSPAPLAAAPPRHSTFGGDDDGAGAGVVLTQKCCRDGEVALASPSPPTTAGTSSLYSCVSRTDAADLDWLGDVTEFASTPSSSSSSELAAAATTTERTDDGEWSSSSIAGNSDNFRVLDPRPNLNTSYGVPPCSTFSVLYPGLFPSQEFFVFVDGYLRKKSGHVQPPGTYCVDRFVLSQNVTSTIRGAVICAEFSWLPPPPSPPPPSSSPSTKSSSEKPADDDRGGRGGAIRKCCGPTEVLDGVENKCVERQPSSESSGPILTDFPVTDSRDGRPLPPPADDNDDGRRRLVPNVLRDEFDARRVAATVRARCDRLDRVANDFYVLETGRLYLPSNNNNNNNNNVNDDQQAKHQADLVMMETNNSTRHTRSADPGTTEEEEEAEEDAWVEYGGGIGTPSPASARQGAGIEEQRAVAGRPLVEPETFCVDEVQTDEDAAQDAPHYAALICEPHVLTEEEIRAERLHRFNEQCPGRSACVVKCCPVGHMFGLTDAGDTGCEPVPTAGDEWRPVFHQLQSPGGSAAEVSLSVDEYKIVHGVLPVCSPETSSGRLLPQFPNSEPNQTVLLLPDGGLYSAQYRLTFPPPSYCLDRIRKTPGGDLEDIALLCFPKPKPKVTTSDFEWVVVCFLIVSCVFLAATVLLALLLPDSSRLANWTLVSYVSSLLVAMLVLVKLQIGGNEQVEAACVAVAGVMYYFFLAAFLWLNVMSFDIWYTLSRCSAQAEGSKTWVEMFPATGVQQDAAENGGPYDRFGGDDVDDEEEDDDGGHGTTAEVAPMNRTPPPVAIKSNADQRNLPASKANHVRRFLKRCVYGYGIPLFMTGMMLIFQYGPVSQSFLRMPIKTKERCWFDDQWGILFYFYGPLAIILTANVVFFVLTMLFLIRHRRDTRNLNARRRHKQTLWMMVKLFVLMGLGWMAEILTWKLGSKEYEYVTDAVNALTGIFVFLIFVCREKTLRELRTRLSLLFRCSSSAGPRHRPRQSATIVTNSSNGGVVAAAVTTTNGNGHNNNGTAAEDVDKSKSAAAAQTSLSTTDVGVSGRGNNASPSSSTSRFSGVGVVNGLNVFGAMGKSKSYSPTEREQRAQQGLRLLKNGGAAENGNGATSVLPSNYDDADGDASNVKNISIRRVDDTNGSCRDP